MENSEIQKETIIRSMGWLWSLWWRIYKGLLLFK